jgi:hypothetical protein
VVGFRVSGRASGRGFGRACTMQRDAISQTLRPASRRPRAIRCVITWSVHRRSQFWSQLSPFVGVWERPTDRFASVNEDLRIGLDLGLRIWKAGWVQALAGSNPASSASRKHYLTCGNDVQIRSAGTASHQTSRRPVSIPVSVSAADRPKSGLLRSMRVRRRSLT